MLTNIFTGAFLNDFIVFIKEFGSTASATADAAFGVRMSPTLGILTKIIRARCWHCPAPWTIRKSWQNCRRKPKFYKSLREHSIDILSIWSSVGRKSVGMMTEQTLINIIIVETLVCWYHIAEQNKMIT